MAYHQSYRKKILRNIFIAAVIFAGCLHAQTENVPRDEVLSNLFVDALTFESDQAGKGRVDIYVQVPYPEINFVKEGEQYSGRFDITASMLSEEKQQVWQKSQHVELHVKDFSQTISDRFSNLKQFSTDIEPGTYELLVQVADQESKKVESVRRAVAVKDFGNDTLALSDVMMARRVTADGARKNIVPNVSGVIGMDPASLYLFFEIYARLHIDSVALTCTIINSKWEVVARRTKNEFLTEHRTQTIWQMDTLALAPAHYILRVDAAGIPKTEISRPVHASVSRICVVRMKNMPAMISDIDKATDELLYIAKGSEIEHIRGAATSEEKLKRFLEFWEKHNPNPKDSSNALMEEYYSRIEYANKKFQGYLEGWKTDRGMVLVEFGQPQNIERHPFDSDNKPYEIWYYYSQNREFIFVDETGFGDYRLRYPTTDLWGRIR
jgi:GWxTD domain-containing protein